MNDPLPDGSDLLDRATYEVRESESGETLGTGVLIRPDRVLTCAHIVEEEGQTVFLARYPSWNTAEDEDDPSSKARVLTSARVLHRGDPDGALDLALLELTEPQPGLHVAVFKPHERRGELFTVGFPKGGRKTAVVKSPSSADSEPSEWLRIEFEGEQRVERGFSGAAIWDHADQKALGMVVAVEEEKAYAISTRQIQKYRDAHDPNRAPSEEPQGPLHNVGPHRLLRIKDATTGQLVGQGFRLGPREILTALEVHQRAEIFEIECPGAERPRLGRADRLWPEGSVETASGVALLKLERRDRKTSRYRAISRRNPPEGCVWRASVLPSGDSASEPRFLWGQLAASEAGTSGRSLDLRTTVPGSDLLELQGAAVFVEEPPEAAGLLGVLGIAEHGDTGLEVRLLDKALAEEPEAFGRDASEDQCRAACHRIAGRLRRKELRAVLANAEPNWDLEEFPDSEAGRLDLARELCLSTAPRELAESINKAMKECSDRADLGSAEAAFKILLDALPASMAEFWPREIPDALAISIRLGVPLPTLAELVLAADAGTGADFLLSSSGSSDSTRPTHQIPGPRDGEELWDELDPEAPKEFAGDVIRGLMKFPGQTLEEQKAHQRFLLNLARRRTPARGTPLISPAEEEAVVKSSNEAEHRTRLLFDLINQSLALPTSKGRRLFMVEDEGKGSSRLAQLLPELQRVQLLVSEETLSEFHFLNNYLGQIVHCLQEIQGTEYASDR